MLSEGMMDGLLRACVRVCVCALVCVCAHVCVRVYACICPTLYLYVCAVIIASNNSLGELGNMRS